MHLGVGLVNRLDLGGLGALLSLLSDVGDSLALLEALESTLLQRGKSMVSTTGLSCARQDGCAK